VCLTPEPAMSDQREGKLRPEFQDWYPSLSPGVWYPADVLTNLVFDQLRHGSPRWDPHGRIPPEEHFEYRGGSPRADRSLRTRRTEQPSTGVGT
jgi:hypothetical protein